MDIVTPNGRSYKQPTGLFINNEFVPATSGQTITSIDPAYDHAHLPRGREQLVLLLMNFTALTSQLRPSTLPAPLMSTAL